MATTIEIINGISQAMTLAHDGAIDQKGDPIKIGLRREEPVSIHDKRIIDGFGVRINGNKLILNYHGQISLKEVYEFNFEQKITDILNQCVSFLKSEYKKVTKNTLSLKALGEPKIRVEHMNKYRSWVIANCVYEISGIKEETNEKVLNKSFKKWLKDNE